MENKTVGVMIQFILLVAKPSIAGRGSHTVAAALASDKIRFWNKNIKHRVGRYIMVGDCPVNRLI